MVTAFGSSLMGGLSLFLGLVFLTVFYMRVRLLSKQEAEQLLLKVAL